LAQTAAAVAFGVPSAELRAPSRRGATIAFARQSAIYLAHVTLGLNIAAVAQVFGRDRSTAVHACRLVEDRRDDPLLDAVLEALESICLERRAQS
jgi:chromosomal replication initiation ATPase DnaA